MAICLVVDGQSLERSARARDAYLRPRLFISLPVRVEIRVSLPLGWLEIVRESGSTSTVVSRIWRGHSNSITVYR